MDVDRSISSIDELKSVPSHISFRNVEHDIFWESKISFRLIFSPSRDFFFLAEEDQYFPLAPPNFLGVRRKWRLVYPGWGYLLERLLDAASKISREIRLTLAAIRAKKMNLTDDELWRANCQLSRRIWISNFSRIFNRSIIQFKTRVLKFTTWTFFLD